MHLLHRSRRSRASVLLAVLVFIAMASGILVLFLADASEKIKYYGLFYNRDDLRAKAYNGLDIALAVISEVNEIDQKINAPAQGWGNPLGYSGIELEDVSIRVTDESSRIPLRDADEELLSLFFEEMEIGPGESGEMIDSLLDWTDEDDLVRLNGAETDHYVDQETPIKPPNAPIQSWDELKLIKGFDEYLFDENGLPNEVHARFLSTFTLYDVGQVNMNAATPFVLDLLGRHEGFDAGDLPEYIAGDDGERGTEDDNLINSQDDYYYPPGAGGRSSLTGIETRTFKVDVTARSGGASFLISTIVRLGGSASGDAGGNANRATARLRDVDEDRGERQTADPSADTAALNYPFEIIRLVENYQL